MLLPLELFFALVSLLLSTVAYQSAAQAWRFDQQPIDQAMRVISFLWFAYVVASLAHLAVAQQMAFYQHASGYQHAPSYAQAIIFEFLLVGVALFLLATASAVRPWILAVLALQLIGGLLELGCRLQDVQPTDALLTCWITLKLVVAACLVVCIGRQVWFTRSRRSWLALAACAMGLGLWVYRAVAPPDTPMVLPVNFYAYAFFLFVVWKLVSLNPDADKRLANIGSSFESAASGQNLSSLTADDDLVLLAVRGERQRIAYELHDNVGSQLVSILFAMQGANPPEQRFVMLSLEQCLSDLKMSVDAMESFDDNVPLSLGSLRYRIQPALDRQEITMFWNVELSDALDAVQGVYAQQVLRIAQESLANVMRHAKAKSVQVHCRYVPEFRHLCLEVCDDGVGFCTRDGNKPKGRGLVAMKRRAAAVGGFLTISSLRAKRSVGTTNAIDAMGYIGNRGNMVKVGTRVCFILPLPHLNPSQPTDPKAPQVSAAGVAPAGLVT